jgi:membrane protein DedA with SNARE-associated domain
VVREHLLTFLAIAIATFASEDLTCIGTGLLIQRGQLDLTSGILACTIGIFVGDVGLWALGRAFGRAALAWSWTATRLSNDRVRHARRWLDRHAAGAIVGSRFMPGTRFALYVMAGVLRMRGVVFALWALVAAVLWTPTIVLLTAALGDVFVARIAPIVGASWPTRIAAAVVALGALHLVRSVTTKSRRIRIAADVARLRRWEFWPMWLFYAPVAVWIALLALWHRGLSTITAANPGIPDGGTVGESKFDILQRLPSESTIPSFLIPSHETATGIAFAQQEVSRRGWEFPLVIKPDVGQRGAGVRLARGWDDVATYLTRVTAPVLVQPYHAGPYEAGVFYYRVPGAARGRIFSITDKQFPVLIGDGRSTIEELIWTHPRFRMQARTFAARHESMLARVLEDGERFPLVTAGNHAQGTLFRDGAHLITPALERRIDDIARRYPGFFVGRFDIRYGDVEAFKAGCDLAIVELNGATGESTNIYDPARTLWRAYRVLFRQWSIVFAIGAANRRRGAPVTSRRRLAALIHGHLTSAGLPISD